MKKGVIEFNYTFYLSYVIYYFFSETKYKHFNQKIETNIIYKCVCIFTNL
jgi:hypothetical protein